MVAELDARLEEASERLGPVVRWIDEGRLPADGVAAQFVRTRFQILLK